MANVLRCAGTKGNKEIHFQAYTDAIHQFKLISYHLLTRKYVLSLSDFSLAPK